MPKKPFKDPIGQPFRIPEAILQMLSEVTGGNFILFHVDNQGEPGVIADFQNSITELGLRSFVTTFISSVNTSEEIIQTQSMVNDNLPPPDLDEDSEQQ